MRALLCHMVSVSALAVAAVTAVIGSGRPGGACARLLLVVLQCACRDGRAAPRSRHSATATQATRSFRPGGPRRASSSGGGRSTAYCVRTCDGRYFPLSANNEQSRAATCSSLCPASDTKVFYGCFDRSCDERERQILFVASERLQVSRAARQRLHLQRQGSGWPGIGQHRERQDLRKGDIVAGENGLIVASRAGRPQTRCASPISRRRPAAIRAKFERAHGARAAMIKSWGSGSWNQSQPRTLSPDTALAHVSRPNRKGLPHVDAHRHPDHISRHRSCSLSRSTCCRSTAARSRSSASSSSSSASCRLLKYLAVF